MFVSVKDPTVKLIILIKCIIDRNEKEVGQAIKDSGIPREQLFITTKL
jgi:hypothetical protein